MATYYSVITCDGAGKWAPQFGSYDKKEAIQELEGMRDSEPGLVGRVIGTGASQAGIEYAINILNSGGRW